MITHEQLPTKWHRRLQQTAAHVGHGMTVSKASTTKNPLNYSVQRLHDDEELQIIASEYVKSKPMRSKVTTDETVYQKGVAKDEESRDDDQGEGLGMGSDGTNREPIITRHSGVESDVEEVQRTGCIDDAPDDESHTIAESSANNSMHQMMERFKSATHKWNVFRDEELIEELLLSNLPDEHGDDEEEVSLTLVTNPLSLGGSQGIVAETATNIWQFDFLSTFSSCLETLADIGQHLCGVASVGSNKETPKADTKEENFWIRYKEPVPETRPSSTTQGGTKTLKSENLSFSFSSLTVHKRSSYVEGDAIVGNVAENNPIIPSIALHGAPSKDRCISPTVNESPVRVHRETTTEAPADQSCDAANGAMTCPQVRRNELHHTSTKSNGNRRKRKKSRLLQRVMFQCYMSWCALRSQLRKPFTRYTTGRRRGRPEWVQVPQEDSLDRLVDAIQASPGSDRVGRSMMTLRPWGRPTRTRLVDPPSVISQLTSHAESSSLGIVMAETRLEI